MLILALAVVLAAAGCSVNNTTPSGSTARWNGIKSAIHKRYPAVPAITTDELAKWMSDSQGASLLLLDAREPEEYLVSHLGGALHASRLDVAAALIAELARDRVVVYCSVGYRSAALAQDLREAGHDNVYNLEGSIFQWANEGRALYSSNGAAHVVHPYDEDWGVLLDEPLRWKSPPSEP